MKKYNALAFILLATVIVSCNDTKKYFSIDESKLEAQYKPENSLLLSVLNPENKAIDSVVYTINNKRVGSSKELTPFKFELKNQKFGYQNITTSIFFDGKTEVDSARVEVISGIQPKLFKYAILNTYAHDFQSFTEGFEFHNDTLYESTGQKGNSYFRKYDYKTGKVFNQIDLDAQYFGEGITIINNQLFQLTWQENVGFIYDLKTLKKIQTFSYDKKIEGWGMTNDGVSIYHSDGTEKIWKMDPKTQKTIDYINVYAGADKIKSLNELEYIDSKIYANIWQKDAIAVINPENGMVEGILNLADLRKQLKYKDAEVLNGIAYNPKTKTIFVTGKNWDKMFEIKVTGL